MVVTSVIALELDVAITVVIKDDVDPIVTFTVRDDVLTNIIVCSGVPPDDVMPRSILSSS